LWWKRSPQANIGIACGALSGDTVVDLDPANGAESSIAALAARGMIFPPTLRATTPNGGWHLFYRYQPGIRNWTGKIAPGIDTRNDAGYVVAAPSRVPRKADGVMTAYAWVDPATGEIRDDARLPEAIQIAPFPAWVVDIVAPKPVYRAFRPINPSAPQDIRPLTDFVARAADGNRNCALYWAARRAAGSGNLTPSAERAFLDAAIAAGLERDKSQATIQSAIKGAERQ
jgi:hypothetical protein